MSDVKILPIRGNKGRIDGIVGKDGIVTNHFIDIQRFSGVSKNPPRENTAPGDGGFSCYAHTLKSLMMVVQGRIVHNNPMGLALLGTQGTATMTLTTGKTLTGTAFVYEAPLSWVRPAQQAYIQIVFRMIFNGTFSETP